MDGEKEVCASTLFPPPSKAVGKKFKGKVTARKESYSV